MQNLSSSSSLASLSEVLLGCDETPGVTRNNRSTSDVAKSEKEYYESLKTDPSSTMLRIKLVFIDHDGEN